MSDKVKVMVSDNVLADDGEAQLYLMGTKKLEEDMGFKGVVSMGLKNGGGFSSIFLNADDLINIKNRIEEELKNIKSEEN